MTDEQISTIVNQFCRVSVLFTGYDPDNFKGLVAVLDKEDDGWSLNAMQKSDVVKYKHALVIDLPEMPEDQTDGLIMLAGALSTRLSKFARARRANMSKSAEERIESARNAGKNRWK